MASFSVINIWILYAIVQCIIFVQCKSNEFRGLPDQNLMSRGDFVTEVKTILRDELMPSLISELKAELKESLKDEIRRELKRDMLNDVKENIYKTVRAELLVSFDTMFYDKMKTQLKATMQEEIEQKLRSEISGSERKHCCKPPSPRPSAVQMSSIQNSSNVESGGLNQQNIVNIPLNNTSTSYTKNETPLQSILNGQNQQNRGKRAIGNVAFSAFLDHSIQHLAHGTTIKYNKVLLNDGGAYNHYTGIFTAPTSGVYMFAFEFLSSSRTTLLRLVVNNANEVDGKVEYGNAGTFGLQGGNIAILKLSQGYSVWVENYKVDGAVVTARNDYRFTTFSGVWLY